MEMAHKNEENDDKQDTKEDECQETTDSLLKELREIKNNILCLNERVKLNHQELSFKMADSIEIKEILVSQSEKIDQLNKENIELRSLNSKLEKDILELQESSLCLKVDITGIPESNYETYDQLCCKIGEIMMSVC